jgi:hypothetical protein
MELVGEVRVHWPSWALTDNWSISWSQCIVPARQNVMPGNV